jgi:hypothetical protein
MNESIARGSAAELCDEVQWNRFRPELSVVLCERQPASSGRPHRLDQQRRNWRVRQAGTSVNRCTFAFLPSNNTGRKAAQREHPERQTGSAGRTAQGLNHRPRSRGGGSGANGERALNCLLPLFAFGRPPPRSLLVGCAFGGFSVPGGCLVLACGS